MARRGVSLGTKLVVGTVFLLAAAVATSVWYSRTSVTELAGSLSAQRVADLEQALDREATQLARNAASNAPFVSGSDYSNQEEAIRQFTTLNKNVVWVALIEKDGKVATASPAAPSQRGAVFDDKLFGADSAAKVEQAAPGEAVRKDLPGSKQLVLGIQLYVSNKISPDDETPARYEQIPVGQARLAIDVSALDTAKAQVETDRLQRANDLRQRQLIFGGIVLAVGLLLGIVQGVRIARPLRTLSAQARHIADGDFARRVNFRRRDEVGELADTFNVMAESLGVMVDEVSRKAGLEREVEVARSIQGLMTPPADVMTLGRFKLTGRCEMASACGGDWWSYRPLSDGRLLVVVGDVTGHGMPSAMIAATARGAVEALSIMDHTSLNAKLVLQAIDRAIRDVGGRRLMMTCFALVIAPDGKIAYANAGHTFPYVVRLNNAAAELSILPMRSNPLGSNNPLIATGEAILVPGDFMVLTSDGLTDRISESGLRFGDKRLRKTLIDQLGRSRGDIGSICDRIVDEVNTFGGTQPVDDDITLVVVQYTGTATDSKTERGVAA